ncbi:MAG: hypothetical protein PHV37_09060 [Candidatus Gastranaerophilales bacterium]|nr:hypothetical protein [Candidatus Gastranaerophilales bacterium]
MDEQIETTVETPVNQEETTKTETTQEQATENQDDKTSDKSKETDETKTKDKENQESEKDDDKSKEIAAPDSYDYSAVKLPDGMQLDNEVLGEFEPIAKKMNLSQEQANEFVNLAVKLVGKQSNKVVEAVQQIQQDKMAQYKQLLNTDKEIGNGDKAQMDAYIDVADIGYKAFANETVKGLLAESGLNFHPEIVKMFHRIGSLCNDDKLPNANFPTGKEQSAAEILYGSTADE